MSYKDTYEDHTIYNNGYYFIQVLDISFLLSKFGKAFQVLLLQWKLKSRNRLAKGGKSKAILVSVMVNKNDLLKRGESS